MNKYLGTEHIIPAFSILFFVLCFGGGHVSAQMLKPGEIVYSRMPGNINFPPQGANSPTIWAVGQDGTNDRQITTGTMPRISDDGRFLLFKRFTRHPVFNPFGGNADVFVRELVTGQESLIFAFNFEQATFGYGFSPESNQGNNEIVIDRDCFMYKTNRDGSNVFTFPWINAPYCLDDFPSVRRGGDQLIAFHNLSNDGANGGGLYTVGIGGASRVKIPNTGCGDIAPAWANDGLYIAYGSLFDACTQNFPQIAYPYFISNLYKIKSDGTARQQLTNFSGGNCANAGVNCLTFGMVWTENNARLITAGRINSTPGLYAFDTDGNAGFSQIPISAGNAPDFVGGIVQPRVERQVLSFGGGVTASGSYRLVSTIGEPVAGQTSAGGTYNFESGFWAIPRESKRTPFDYDADGKTDISVYRPAATGTWYINRSTAGFYGLEFGGGADKIVPADYDGDGKTDIAVYRPSEGMWYRFMSATASFTATPFGLANDIPAPGDFDNDGRADIAIFRPSDGNWWLNRSTAGVLATQWGQNGDVPVVGDYDGDGTSDIGIFRPSSGVWFINRSTAGIIGFAFGFGTDRVTPADYDGDGKTDIAVYRGSTGQWFIANSGSATYPVHQFGAPTDIPVPGDYDGDGRADIAIFRPSDGNWWINRTAAGLTVIPFGQNGDRPTPNAYGN